VRHVTPHGAFYFGEDKPGFNWPAGRDGLLFPASNDFQGSIKACLSAISKAKGLRQEAHLLFLYAATTTRYAYPLTSGGDLAWTRGAAARR
jgi:hypothetical protein